MPFAYGAPRGLGRAALRGLTGLSRDFNYFTGDNPGNWNIPEGMTNLRKESFKDRGKWYNPFDTKRVTTYEYSKPGEPGAPGTPGASGTPGSTTGTDANEYGVRTNTEGLSGKAARAIRRGERRTERQTRRGMEEFPEAFQEGPIGTTNTTPNPSVQPTPSPTNQPMAPRFNSGTGMSSIFEGLDVPPPNSYQTPATGSNPSVGNFSQRYNTGSGMSSVFEGLDVPPVNNPLVQPNPMSQPLYKPGSGSGSGMFNVSGEFEEGGYIPDYYTFDGYLPMAGTGIVSDTPDFQVPQDPNSVKYRIEEQSGWSWDPNQLGNTIGVGSNIASNILEDIQSVGAKRFGSNKQNYARDIDRQLAYRGVTDQEGIDKKAGFESGRTYTGKYGGSKYKSGGQYKSGGTYSLTQEQIDQIRKMGGDVEFI